MKNLKTPYLKTSGRHLPAFALLCVAAISLGGTAARIEIRALPPGAAMAPAVRPAEARRSPAGERGPGQPGTIR